ncbi:alanine racemase [Hypnocyclicus thermotrophus]|uniref:Alanine racemase n=1 Tax=Hypnocyclicus thermotrophus TaxID=1627895 RepID=A0AA46DXD8_9FUSO|nr:alanine racemase [Hypnocyclicus thermotrophus]TDT68030.1 alanine racemase [Hypnocyclicus thermotrophus]
MYTWLEIDLNKLEKNYNYIKKYTNKNIIPIVKANAYGMGAIEISRFLQNKFNIEIFAVANYKEAIELYNNGITSNILIFNEIESEYLKKSIDKNFIFTIFNLFYLKKWIFYLKNDISKIKFHIKFNTGLNRLGLEKEDIPELIELVHKYNINIAGIYTHFATADSNIKFMKNQIDSFNDIISILKKYNLNYSIIHLSNSPASFNEVIIKENYARIGMALYGLQPIENKNINITPIFKWKAKIIDIRYIKKGEGVSYSQTILNKDSKIGVVPVGYADGYMRQLSNKAYVLYNNNKCKIIGNICMEKIIIDFTDTNAKIDDEVIILGNNIDIEEFAKNSNTIADDIISKFSKTITRRYIYEE